MKRFRKVFVGILLVFLTLFLIAVMALWIKSSGTTPPLKDDKGVQLPNSINTIEKLNIGNLDQYLIIRGEDKGNPVMLFLHGGPGSPSFPLMRNKNLDLEKEFVMVYWEQRGAGKSYAEDIPESSMNLEQIMQDIKQISSYLKQQFDKEKIYLAGHSWGTFIGMTAAYKYPELFHAYIGIGQAGNQYLGEQTSLEWIKKQAKERNDQAAMKEINQIIFPAADASIQEWLAYLQVERKYVNDFGGGIRREPVNVFNTFAKMVINASEYTISEKLNYEKASFFCMHHFWSVLMQNDLNTTIGRVQIPVYLLHGRHDYQTPHKMALSFFNQLDAEEKMFFTFENTAHSPFMDEPKKFNQILLEHVLKKDKRNE